MAKINRLLLLYIAILLLTVQSPAQQEITHDRLAATYVVSHEYGGSSLMLEADGRYSKESASHDGTEWLESGTYILARGVLRFTIVRSVQRRRGDVKEINLLDPKERKQALGDNSTAETVREYELRPIIWSDRIYLIYESDLNNFANAINLGLEPRRTLRSEHYYGAFYLREGDEAKRASGHPSLPSQWLSSLLSKPVTATVIGIEESKKGTYWASSTVRIDKGSRDGLRVGMRLIINDEEPSTSHGAEIISVEEKTARVRTQQITTELKLGDMLSTRDGPLLDKYGPLRWEEEKARLAKFAALLGRRPTSQGYVIAYAGRRARAGEALMRANRAREYLEGELKMERGRIVAVDGGYRDHQAVELFAVRAGSNYPEATPTVKPAEVKIIPDKVKSGNRRR